MSPSTTNPKPSRARPKVAEVKVSPPKVAVGQPSPPKVSVVQPSPPKVPAVQPSWRARYDSIEAAVGPRLFQILESEQFQIAAGLTTQVRKGIQQRAARGMRRGLHMCNLPAGSDVTRILNELGRLRREVRELGDKVAKQSNSDGGE